jgi:hypothetical protein
MREISLSQVDLDLGTGLSARDKKDKGPNLEMRQNETMEIAKRVTSYSAECDRVEHTKTLCSSKLGNTVCFE